MPVDSVLPGESIKANTYNAQYPKMQCHTVCQKNRRPAGAVADRPQGRRACAWCRRRRRWRRRRRPGGRRRRW